MSIASLLITLFIAAMIFAVLYWFVGEMPLPAPFGMVARAFLALAVVLFLLGLLTGQVPMVRLT